MINPTYAKTSSRDIADLHPELQKLFRWVVEVYQYVWGSDVPQMFLTQTTRGEIDQQRAVDGGYSWVNYPNSDHNVLPALAFDVAFDPVPRNGIGNDVAWGGEKIDEAYRRMAEIAESVEGINVLDEIHDSGHVGFANGRVNRADYMRTGNVPQLELPTPEEWCRRYYPEKLSTIAVNEPDTVGELARQLYENTQAIVENSQAINALTTAVMQLVQSIKPKSMEDNYERPTTKS